MTAHVARNLSSVRAIPLVVLQHHDIEGNRLEKSSPKKDRKFLALDCEEQEILAAFKTAITSLRVKDTAHAANVTPATVKNWRQGNNGAVFVKAIRLGRRVPKVRAAIVNLLDRGGSQARAEVNYLLRQLGEIAATTTDHVAAAHAQQAIREFSTLGAAAE